MKADVDDWCPLPAIVRPLHGSVHDDGINDGACCRCATIDNLVLAPAAAAAAAAAADAAAVTATAAVAAPTVIDESTEGSRLVQRPPLMVP